MSRRAALIFVTLGVAWGIPYLLIKVAVGELAPETLVLARTALAAAVLLPIAIARDAVLPVLRRWRPMVAYTVVEICIPWLFLTRAEQVLPSSTTGLLIAGVPVVASVLAVLGAQITGEARERLGATGLGGLLLGILGVVALVGLDIGGSSLPAVAQVGLVIVGYAIGPVILRRYLHDLPGVGVVAVSLAGAALVYLPVVLTGPGLPNTLPSTPVVASVVVLALVCTAAAFLLLFTLVNTIGPVRATAITYLNPAVAVVAGVAVLGEAVTAWTLVGFALVLAGSFLVTRRPAAVPTAEPVATAGFLAEPPPHATGHSDHGPTPVPAPSCGLLVTAQMSRRGSVGHRSEAQAGQLSNGLGGEGGEQPRSSSAVGGVNRVRNRS